MDGGSDPQTALATEARPSAPRETRREPDDLGNPPASNGGARFPLPIVRAVHPDDLSAYYQKYSSNLYRLALSIMGCPEAAKDVVQDAFAATAARLADGLVIDNLGGWLYRVVQYQCRMQHRARPASPLVDGVDVATGMLPDELADLRHRMDQIRRAVDRLGEAQKSAFLLAEVHGLSYREIGERIDRSEDGVRQLLFRARSRVRDAVGSGTFALIPVLLPEAAGIDPFVAGHADALAHLAPRGRLAILRERFTDGIDGLRARAGSLSEGSGGLVPRAAESALPVLAILVAVVLSAPSSSPNRGVRPPAPSASASSETLSPAGAATATANRSARPLATASATAVAAIGDGRSGAQSGNGGVTSPNRSDATDSAPVRQESSGVQPSTSSGGSTPASRTSPGGTAKPRMAYVTGSRKDGGEVSVFDTFVDDPASATSSPVSDMDDPSQRATAVAFTPNGQSAYVALRPTSRPGGRQEDLAVVDTARAAFDRWINVPSDPAAVTVAPDNSNAFLGYAITPQGGSSSGVWAVATANDQIARVGGTDSHFHGVAITPDSSAVYVSDTGGVDVYGAPGPWPQEPRRIALQRPGAIAITPNGTRAYVTGYDAICHGFTCGSPSAWDYRGKVSVIGTESNDGQTYDSVETISGIGEPLYDIAITPDGKRAYITDPLAGVVRMIGTDPSDPNTYNREAWTPIEVETPGAIAITPNGKRAYVTSLVSNRVTMINTDIGSPSFNSTRCCVTAGTLRATDIAIVPNQSPSVASLTAAPAAAGAATTMTAEGATDPDGYVAHYRWDFGDGAPAVTTDEPATTHTYAGPGTYTASVTAIDNEGGDGTLVTDGRAIYHNRSEGARKEVPIPVGPGPTAGDSPGEQGTASQDCASALASQPVSVSHWLPFAGSYFRLKAAPGAHSAEEGIDVTVQTRNARNRVRATVKFSADGNLLGTDAQPPYEITVPASLRGAHRVAAVITSKGKKRALTIDVYGLTCESSALSVSMRGKVPGSKTDVEFRAQTGNRKPLSAATFTLAKLLRVNPRKATGTRIGTLQLLSQSGEIKFSRPLMLVRKGQRTFELAGKGNGPKATLARSRSGHVISLSGLGRFEAPRVRLVLFGRGNGFLRNALSCRRYLYRAVLTTTDGQTAKLKRGLRMCKGRRGTG